MFQYMAKSFISVIDQTLSEIDAWNSEVSQAWVQLFQWITFGLGKGKYKSIIGLVPTTKIIVDCWTRSYQLSHEALLSHIFIGNFVCRGIRDVVIRDPPKS